MVHVAGAPISVVDNAILTAAGEFYQRTRAWVMELPLRGAQAGIMRVPVTLAEDGVAPISIEWVKFRGRPLGRVHPNMLHIDMKAGDPIGYVSARSGTYIDLYPAPARTEAAVVQIAAHVRPDVVGPLPDDASTFHREGLVAGALAVLYGSPNKPYSAPSQVTMQRALFNRAIAQAMTADQNARGAGSASPQIHTVPMR